MKQLLSGFIFGVFVVLFPVAGFADEGMLFDRLDSDKSGSISREELLKSDLVVEKDKEGQRKVFHRDMVKGADAASMTEEHKKNLFDQIDKDKDGYINKEEWKRASMQGFIIWRF